VKYGIFLGRFQPFHKGHAYIIENIIKKNLEPVIFIGSVNKLDDKNPLTFEQRKILIKKVFSQIKYILPLNDTISWNEWWDNLESEIKKFSRNKKDIIFVTHKKEKDKCNFVFKGKEYFDNYQMIFEKEGYKTIEIENYSSISNKDIHATDIRSNENCAKEYLHPEVYECLKKHKFWGYTWYNECDRYKIVEYTNWIKVWGGDGTMLRAVDNYKYLNKPFFGIGRGTVNFLMNNEEIIKNPVYVEVNLIGVELNNKTYTAFNEIMLGGDMASWIEFNVKDKDEIIGEFKGGGIIVSTSQGSTGINKNNNGTILPLSSKNWVITGDKTNRKINYVIEPQELKIEFKSRTPVHLWCDGRKIKTFDSNILHKINIINPNQSVKLLFNNIHEFKKKRRL